MLFLRVYLLLLGIILVTGLELHTSSRTSVKHAGGISRRSIISENYDLYSVLKPTELDCTNTSFSAVEWSSMTFSLISDTGIDSSAAENADDVVSKCAWWYILLLTGDTAKANSVIGSVNKREIGSIVSIIEEYSDDLGSVKYQMQSTASGYLHGNDSNK